jgi:hypothetical protein
MFGEEPSVLSSSSLCDCTKLGNEDSDMNTRIGPVKAIDFGVSEFSKT